ncbi:MAG: hypothetical protein D6830_03320, partial [Ignavibacteria bacterium]
EYSSGFESIDEAIEQAANTQSDLIVICSTDDNYKEIVLPLVKELKSRTNKQLILAGNPKADIDKYFEAGLDGNIYLGQDVLEFLNDILDKIENSNKVESERK